MIGNIQPRLEVSHAERIGDAVVPALQRDINHGGCQGSGPRGGGGREQLTVALGMFVAKITQDNACVYT